MVSKRAYVDPDLLVAAAVGLFVLAFLSAFFPFALFVALGAGVVAAALHGRQRDGLHRALFVGLAPAAGGTLAQLLRLGEPAWGFFHHVGMGLTTGLLVAFFGYAVGTLEYGLAEGTPSPRRRDVARFAAFVLVGLSVVVAVRLLTPDPVLRGTFR